MSFRSCAMTAAIALVVSVALPARAAEIVARLSVPGASSGEVGCTLYDASGGFPMDANRALASNWVPAAEVVECRFTDLAPGRYAVAASHDQNGNRKVDTNIVGMPKEGWGVSRNARPTLRAPRFEEAALSLDEAGSRVEIQIEVRR